MVFKVISENNLPAAGPYSPAVEAGGMVFCSGQLPLDPLTGEAVTQDIEAATRLAMENLGAVLAAAGLGFENVVRTTIFLKNLDDFPAVNAVYGSFFSGSYPARSTVQAAGLPKGVPLEIDAIAVR